MIKNLIIEIDDDKITDIINKAISASEIQNEQKIELTHKNLTPKKMLRIKDLCEMFSVTRVTIHTWKKEGRIPYFKVSRRVYFDYDEVIKSLQKYDLSSVQNFNKARRTN